MQIKVKRNDREVFFPTVEPGQIFIYDDLVYMRLNDDYAVHDGYGDFVDDFNAVLLLRGELYHFGNSDMVQLPIKVTPLEVEC